MMKRFTSPCFVINFNATNIIAFIEPSIFSLQQQLQLSGQGERLAPSKPWFNFHWYQYESLVAAVRASGQNCFSAPVKVLPWYLGTMVGMSEPLNKGVNDVKSGRFPFNSPDHIILSSNKIQNGGILVPA